jgi:hypothetical protein
MLAFCFSTLLLLISTNNRRNGAFPGAGKASTASRGKQPFSKEKAKIQNRYAKKS